MAAGVSPGVIREHACGVLIAAPRCRQVAQVERRTVRALCEHDPVYIVERSELAVLFDFQVAAAGTQSPCGQGRVAVLHNGRQRGRRHTERRQAVLRRLNLNLFFEQADSGNPRCFGSDLDGFFYAVGEIVEFPIGVFGARFPAKRLPNVGIRGQDNGVPHIGMNVGALRHFLPHSLDRLR